MNTNPLETSVDPFEALKELARKSLPAELFYENNVAALEALSATPSATRKSRNVARILRGLS